MRILFAGTPEIACPALAALIDEQIASGGRVCEVAGVLTNADAAQGRRSELQPSAVGAAAEIHSGRLCAAGCAPLAIFKFERLSAAEISPIKAVNCGLLVSFAYGKIFPSAFLDIFSMGGVNIHPSLLPKYRGPSPIQTAILKQEAETGITIQRLSAEMDAGNILAQESFPLDGTETSGTLSTVAAERGAAMLVRMIRDLQAGNTTERAQDAAQATFCEKLNRHSGRIDWGKSARVVDAQIRALSPEILCQTQHGERMLYILEGSVFSGTIEPVMMTDAGSPAPGTVLGQHKKEGILIQCGEGVYAARVVQYGAKKALDFRAFMNGAKNFTGTLLS
ncbi:MAG: methionyl-tRNA formyltransferase [Spirochaetaceae bacterium]|jgi:methionyl-tRNA formyltransferase|nr:methionyl-tRNA formyltransferase [Spirochaetaceae bacterium]